MPFDFSAKFPGKTYTMMGPGRNAVDVNDRKFYAEDGTLMSDIGQQGMFSNQRNEGAETPPKGIFLLAAEDIFRSLEQRKQTHQNERLAVVISFYEIYCGKLFDLLNNRQPLHARENHKNKTVISGLQEERVRNVMELMNVIEFGLQSRTTSATGANVDSRL
jgi:hypothetical protein